MPKRHGDARRLRVPLMRCPHCPDSFTPQWSEQQVGSDPDSTGVWYLRWTNCPSCERLVVDLLDYGGQEILVLPAYPAIPVPVIPNEIEEPFDQEFREAAATLKISPKASAALSRRLLQ